MTIPGRWLTKNATLRRNCCGSVMLEERQGNALDAETDARDGPRGFVPEHQRRLVERRHVVIDVVQVGVAQAAGRNAYEHLTRSRHGDGPFFDLERAMRAVENRRLHRVFRLRIPA
jgi:hypothetical protein